MQSKRLGSFFIFFLGFMLSISAASDEQLTSKQKASLYDSGFLDEGGKAPSFFLTNQDEEKVTLEQFKGKFIFLTFIYTSCFTECSMLIHSRDNIQKSIEEQIGKKLVFLAMTIDPENDTPKILKEYIHRLKINPENLHFLTGKPDSVKKVLKDYKIKVAKIAETGKVVGHPNMGYLIDENSMISRVILFEY